MPCRRQLRRDARAGAGPDPGRAVAARRGVAVERGQRQHEPVQRDRLVGEVGPEGHRAEERRGPVRMPLAAAHRSAALRISRPASSSREAFGWRSPQPPDLLGDALPVRLVEDRASQGRVHGEIL